MASLSWLQHHRIIIWLISINRQKSNAASIRRPAGTEVNGRSYDVGADYAGDAATRGAALRGFAARMAAAASRTAAADAVAARNRQSEVCFIAMLPACATPDSS